MNNKFLDIPIKYIRINLKYFLDLLYVKYSQWLYQYFRIIIQVPKLNHLFQKDLVILNLLIL